MADEYQRGSDQEWLQHSNEELATLVKKRERQVKFWKFLSLVLFLALAWAAFRFRQHAPIEKLWKL